MASYHFTIKSSAETQATADMRSDYINREGKFAYGTKAEELIDKAHGNMPEWAQGNPNVFWSASEAYEKAAKRVSFREIEFALPNELDVEQQKSLVKEFIDNHFGTDFVYSYAIHEKSAALAYGVQNPHVHILFCERQLDGLQRDKKTFFKRADHKQPERGGAPKAGRWNGDNRKGYLRFMREDCAKLQNRYLEAEGFTERVDHRTKDAQYLDAIESGNLDQARLLEYPAEKHLGPKLSSKVARELQILTAGIANPKERKKLRSEYWKAKQAAKEDKLSLLRHTRNIKQNIQLQHALDTKRSPARQQFSREYAEQRFWQAKKRELSILRSQLNVEKYRLEQAEANNVRNLKVAAWRVHFERRLAEYAVLQNKAETKYIGQEEEEQITKIQNGILAIEQNKEVVQKQTSQLAILKQLYPELAGQNTRSLKRIASQHMNRINESLAQIRKAERMVEKRIRTEIQARMIAEWRASKGLLASIRRDEKRLLEHKKALKKEQQSFEKSAAPEETNKLEVLLHDVRLEHIEDWQVAVKELTDSISSRHKGWEVQKKNPVIMNQILSLQARYNARNADLKQKVVNMKKAKAALYQERSQWRRLEYSLNRPNEQGRFLQSCQNVHQQLQKIVRHLREERVKGRISGLKLFVNDEEYKEKENEIS